MVLAGFAHSRVDLGCRYSQHQADRRAVLERPIERTEVWACAAPGVRDIGALEQGRHRHAHRDRGRERLVAHTGARAALSPVTTRVAMPNRAGSPPLVRGFRRLQGYSISGSIVGSAHGTHRILQAGITR
jgi:hypothetical protein